jgi:nucleotide-binding universal stress UspA family protein
MSVLIVGLDGSAMADAALGHAAREAAQRGIELRIVHAFGWSTLLPPAYPPYDDSELGPRAAVLDLLAKTTYAVRASWPGLTVTARLVDGSPGAVLVDASREAELVVVGHRGLGGFAGLLAGSTAMQLAAHGACPVTVVRGAETSEQGVIVLGMDGSSHALAAADVAFSRARRTGVDLVALYHEAPSDADAGAVATQIELLGRRYSDVKFTCRAGQGSSAAMALIEAANDLDAGMIVVGTRGRGGLRGLIAGSTSRAVIEHADCPVTVVPSGITSATATTASAVLAGDRQAT